MFARAAALLVRRATPPAACLAGAALWAPSAPREPRFAVRTCGLTGAVRCADDSADANPFLEKYGAPQPSDLPNYVAPVACLRPAGVAFKILKRDGTEHVPKEPPLSDFAVSTGLVFGGPHPEWTRRAGEVEGLGEKDVELSVAHGRLMEFAEKIPGLGLPARAALLDAIIDAEGEFKLISRERVRAFQSRVGALGGAASSAAQIEAGTHVFIEANQDYDHQRYASSQTPTWAKQLGGQNSSAAQMDDGTHPFQINTQNRQHQQDALAGAIEKNPNHQRDACIQSNVKRHGRTRVMTAEEKKAAKRASRLKYQEKKRRLSP